MDQRLGGPPPSGLLTFLEMKENQTSEPLLHK